MILALVTHGYLMDGFLSPPPPTPTGGIAVVDPRPRAPLGSAVVVSSNEPSPGQ